MASFTVNFKDGSSHTYDNVPEGVTQDDVNARAQQENPDKEIGGIVPAEASQASPIMGAGTENPDATFGQKALAAGQSALNLTGEALQSPIGHVAEAAYGYKKIAQPLINSYLQRGAQAMPSTGPVAPPATPTPSPIVVPQNTGGVPRPQMPAGTPAQTMDTLRQPMRPMAPPATPPVGGPAAQQADNFLSSIASKYGQVANKVAPVLNRVAPALEGAGKMLAPAMIAKELFYTSPEEQAQLKQMEQSHTGLKDWVNDHLFSQKQDLEKQQLANKHATEMHKYIQAKQKIGNQQ